MLGFRTKENTPQPLPPVDPLKAQRDYNVRSAEALLELLNRGYGDSPKITWTNGEAIDPTNILLHHHKSALEHKRKKSGLTDDEKSDLQLLEESSKALYSGNNRSVIETYHGKVALEERTKNDPSEKNRLRYLTDQEIEVYQARCGRKFAQLWVDYASDIEANLRPDECLKVFQRHRKKLGLKLEHFKNKDGKTLTPEDLDTINFDKTVEWIEKYNKWEWNDKWLADNHLNFDGHAQLDGWLNNIQASNSDRTPLAFYTLKESVVEHPDHNGAYHENMARGLVLDYRDHISGGPEPENVFAPSYLVVGNPLTGIVTTYIACSANEASKSFEEHLKDHGFAHTKGMDAQYKTFKPKAGVQSVLGVASRSAFNA